MISDTGCEFEWKLDYLNPISLCKAYTTMQWVTNPLEPELLFYNKYSVISSLLFWNEIRREQNIPLIL